MVFGYGSAGLGDHAHALGPAACATLADWVSMLGWDLRRLQHDSRLRPVLNALYGNRLNLETDIQQAHAPEPPTDVPVHFWVLLWPAMCLAVDVYSLTQ